MLTSFFAHNYKSLSQIQVPLCGELTIIAGANGAGKTSVCEAMDLSMRLVGARPEEVFRDRDPLLIRNKWLRSNRIELGWEMELDDGRQAQWKIAINKKKHWGVALEEVVADEESFLNRRTTQIKVLNESSGIWEVESKALPSYLSTLVEESQTSYPTLCAVQRELVARYVPFLNPVHLRSRSRRAELGPEGQNFARYLYGLRKESPKEFERALASVKEVFPQVDGVRAVRSRFGWTEVQVSQRVTADTLWQLKAEQVNDGLLRLLALATAPYAAENLCLLIVEEPENGMHPRLLEATLNLLRLLPAQVVVTTHSPVLLNFARPEEVLIMRWRQRENSPQVAKFVDLKQGMKRMGHYDVGDVLYNLEDDLLFQGVS